MDVLYIVGNGFDLHHNLDTKYQSFAKHLSGRSQELYDLILNYYGLPFLDSNSSDEEYYEWSKFEEVLANLDYEQALEDNADLMPDIGSPDFRDRDLHSFEIQMELIIEKLTNGLKSEFKDFIFSIDYPDDIDKYLIRLKANSLFLNFNYTGTLEKYYSINRNNICYIHNKAELKTIVTKRTIEHEHQIILGHGTDPDNFRVEKKEAPAGLSPEELEQWRENMSDQYDPSYESAKTEILTYYSKAFKNTKDVISNNRAFFDSLTQISEVYVLGHSISEVDIEYFKKVIASIQKHSKWIVTYYHPNEKTKHIDTLNSLGISKKYIDLVTFSELS